MSGSANDDYGRSADELKCIQNGGKGKQESGNPAHCDTQSLLAIDDAVSNYELHRTHIASRYRVKWLYARRTIATTRADDNSVIWTTN